VAELLELAELAKHYRPSKSDGGSRGIYTKLHSKGSILAEALLQGPHGHDPFGSPEELIEHVRRLVDHPQMPELRAPLSTLVIGHSSSWRARNS